MFANVGSICVSVTDLTKVTHWGTAKTKMDDVGEFWSHAHAILYLCRYSYI